jgi:hypothetical protein
MKIPTRKKDAEHRRKSVETNNPTSRKTNKINKTK